MQVRITRTFLFAHGGTQVAEYREGDTVETEDPELIKVATAEGWIADTATSPRTKARKAAPENK